MYPSTKVTGDCRQKEPGEGLGAPPSIRPGTLPFAEARNIVPGVHFFKKPLTSVIPWRITLGHGNTKMKQIVSLKLEESERLAWVGKAERAGLTLSAWMRKRCNEEEANGAAAVQAVQPNRDVSVLERSTVSAGGSAEAPKPRARKSEFAESVAGRTGHEIGCGCFQCVQAERFFKAMRKEA
jgi:hypothetical protein